MLGTVHVAFGASAGIGGTVSVPVHLDVPGRGRDARRRRHPRARRRALRARGMTRLVAVPNVSEGRDERRARRDRRRVRDARRASCTAPRTPTTTARSSSSRASRGELHRALAAGAAEAAARIDLRAARRPAPARRRARRRAGRLPRRGAARRGDRRGAAGRRRDRRGPGIPVFLYGELAGGRTRAELRKGGPAGLAERGTPPDYGPARAAPDRGRDARRRAAAADRLQRRARAARDARRRAGDRRRDPRRPGAARRPRARAAAGATGRRPGLDQHRGPPRGHGAPTCSPPCGARARGRARPSSSRPRRRPRSPAGRRTSSCACRASIEALPRALTSRSPWPRRSASAAPSTAATPPARSRRAAAPGASPTRPERKKGGGASAREDRRLAEPTWCGRRDPRRHRRRSCCSCSSSSASPATKQSIATSLVLARRRVPDLRAARLQGRPLLLARPDGARPGRRSRRRSRQALSDGRPHLHRRAGAGELPHRPPRRRARGDRDRPGRRGAAACSRRSTRSASRSRRSCSPTRTSTTSARSRRVARATGAEVWCPELEVPVLADIMRYVPWPGFGPFESYDADHTVAGGETARARRAGDRRALHARPLARARDLRGPAEQAIFSGDVLFAGLDRPHRPARRRPRDADADASPRSSTRCPTRPPCTPGTWGTRRSAASAPRTRSWPSSA